ncbi:hypothetical protein FRUB_10371 [Fimbriiglobus ruber]|uniref:Uncharacterized protein n=1 Tax=Fimbriiglobus ruber TaxID=1908690 RepID=A0A225CYE5_9BACT|nr:hypothetical protein FRUB_10371 [Fimbriiglobus ruber]
MRLAVADQHSDTLAHSEPDPRYVCVSAEQTDLTPVPFDWILNKWAEHH